MTDNPRYTFGDVQGAMRDGHAVNIALDDRDRITVEFTYTDRLDGRTYKATAHGWRTEVKQAAKALRGPSAAADVEQNEDGQCFCSGCKARAAAWENEKREAARVSSELVPCPACRLDAKCPVCGGTGEVWQP